MTTHSAHSTVNWQIIAILAFEDNVIWLLVSDDSIFVVDPGDSKPVITWLKDHKRTLTGILLTHEHRDHIGGVADLLKQYPMVKCYGHVMLSSTLSVSPVSAGDTLNLASGLHLQVISLAGHTPTHLGYYWNEQEALFCGDALFACGCGRLFNGGTPAQMAESLDRIKKLPPQTVIYCAHEYTLANCRFAMMVEPENNTLQNRLQEVSELRRQGKLTLPSLLADELHTNPFLRTEQPAVLQAIEKVANQNIDSPIIAFALLREWKDRIDQTGQLDLPA